MKIAVTGSLGNISLGIVKKLVANGHEVKVISSKASRASGIEKLGAVPSIGSLGDADFVWRSFEDVDAVYTMVPPDFSMPDYYEFSDCIHRNYVLAIRGNNIQYAVNLSSAGVALAGTGKFKGFYDPERRLNEIPGLNVIHLRPAMFYTNFYGSLVMVREHGIMGHNLAGTAELIMTHPADIADMAFDLLNTLSFAGSDIRYVISDVRSGNEVAALIGEAVGTQVNWVEFSDDALLAGLLQNGFSRDAGETLVVNAGKAMREGLFDEFKKEVYRATGGRRFEEFAREYAAAIVSHHARS